MILSHFRGVPRPQQVETLLAVEAAWAHYDVFVLRCPVGVGKSRIAHAICSWQGGGVLNTPTNLLVQQYRNTWPELAALPRGAARNSAAAHTVRAAPIKVLNYYSYLAHRMYAPVVCFDEAHRLVPMLQGMEAIKVWPHLTPVPPWVRSGVDLLVWAKSTGNTKLAAKLSQSQDSYTLRFSHQEYRGHERECIEVLPLTPRHNRPILWPPSRVKKLVFLSATFHEEDLYDLGLDGRRVLVLDCDSPVAAEDRQVVYCPVGSTSHREVEATLPKLVSTLGGLLEHHKTERGVVHTTYAMTQRLQATSLGSHPRLRWYDQATKASVYAAWLVDSTPGVTLVAAGLTEGVDLAGDLCRWQAVTSLMYPDMTDPAVLAKAKLRPDWYAWMAARDLQQATGRSSRGPGDWSYTYVLTSDFERLYSKHRNMFVPSFRDSLKGV
jgi:hypothetical protein